MNAKTVIALSVGTGAMWLIMLLLMKRYQVKLWKSLPLALLLTVTGTVSTYIWAYIECSWFGARSYYGAVFLVPMFFILIAKLFRVSYGDLMDFCAPSECAMLVIMKYQCMVDGCCGGKVLYSAPNGEQIVFPSQVVETANALMIMLVLTVIAYRLKWRGKVYPWYLLLYGVSRFVLNWFRADTTPLLMGLPAGNLWSLVAITLGIIWLLGYKVALVRQNGTTPEAQC